MNADRHRHTEQTDKQMHYQTDSLHLLEATPPLIHHNQLHSITHIAHTNTHALWCTHMNQTHILAALSLAPLLRLGFSLILRPRV